jgi:Methyltransferase domain
MTKTTQTVIDRLKLVLHRAFGFLGFAIVRARRRGPEPPVTGTFPPHKEYFTIGQPEHYFIHDGYRHRSEASYFDDTESTDQWQREVYQFAKEVFDQKHLTTVCDIGCGSANKLVRYFAGCNFIGLDVLETCKWLRRKYPNLSWMELDFRNAPSLRADLVIAADVIEHVLNPDELLTYIASLITPSA